LGWLFSFWGSGEGAAQTPRGAKTFQTFMEMAEARI